MRSGDPTDRVTAHPTQDCATSALTPTCTASTTSIPRLSIYFDCGRICSSLIGLYSHLQWHCRQQRLSQHSTSTSASFIAPKEKLYCFTTIGQDKLNKRIIASKPTTCLLDPIPTNLLKELLPVAEEPLLNIINSSLSLGHVPKPFKLAVINPLIMKPKLDPCELANYRPISNLCLCQTSCVCSIVLLLANKIYL